MRIHRTTLAYSTIKKLTKEARTGADWKLTPHAGQMLSYRKLNINDVRDTVREGELIEYNDDFGTRHVLLRGESGVCVVVDLDLKELSTVFYNNPDDNHKTLNRSRYMLS